MKCGELKVKAWFIRREEEKSSRYNRYIDVNPGSKPGQMVTEDEEGFFTVKAIFLGETEKALKLNLSTGDVVGSYKGWNTWVPKSLAKDIVIY